MFRIFKRQGKQPDDDRHYHNKDLPTVHLGQNAFYSIQCRISRKLQET